MGSHNSLGGRAFMVEGFTLIEVLVVLAITSMLFLCAPFLDISAVVHTSPRDEARIFSHALHVARTASLNGINNDAHGVHVGDGVFVVFSGSQYREGVDVDIEFPRNMSIDVEPSNIDTVFEKGTAVHGKRTVVMFGHGEHAVAVTIGYEGGIDF